MKFLIVSGHEGTVGAVSGSFIEEKLTEELAHLVVDELIYQGHDATEYDYNMFEMLEQNPSRLDLRVYDYILEIHFNITKGATGSEIFVAKGTKGISVEQAIMKRMAKYFLLRDDSSPKDGVKEGNYWILNALADRPVALLEVAFMDNANDMAIYTKNKNAIGIDIAHGILEGFEEPIKERPIEVVKVLDPAQEWAITNKIFSDKDWDKPMTKSQVAWAIYTAKKRGLI